MDPVILIVGSDGFIGKALMKQLESARKPVIGTTRQTGVNAGRRLFLDLSGDLEKWRSPWPLAVAVICAGITKIDECRRDPLSTAEVNVRGTVKLIENLSAIGAFIIFLSSNQVFDGSRKKRLAGEPLSPQTHYGKQKAEVERYLSTFGDKAAIVRLTKVLAPESDPLRQWRSALERREVIHPFKDMVMSPVSRCFVVSTLERLIETRLPGIIQISGDEDIIYSEAAHYLARRLGAPTDLVRPIESVIAGIPAESAPAHTTLDTSRLANELGITPPAVWTTIDSLFGAHEQEGT